ncbi:MAG: flagellar hook-length control protein FliK [Sphingopyxis sp.]|nr:flagellar hook-length control protein FliK [Sphingopyxis sp.]
MMSAPSHSMTQGAMPAGFAAFLANIGQVPADGGSEGVGFDQLLAAAPAVPATPAASMTIERPLHTDVAASPVEGKDQDVAVETPTTKPRSSEETAAATLAASLLIALNGKGPVDRSAPAKPVPAEPPSDAAPDGVEIVEAATTAPVADWIAVVAAATPTGTKPAKSVETPTEPADNGAQATSVAARPRDPALPMPLLAGNEPVAAKPVEAAPSMTILFTQLHAQGSGALAETASPAIVAERVLDIDSDGAWINQLARDIAATKSDSGDINFRLMPRHLGRLDVAMRMDDEGVSLKMDTRHEATATIVTAAQGKLVEELRQQGVRVSGAEVTWTPGETGRQSQGQGRAAVHDPAHLVETATEHAEPRDEDRAADRRGRFA